MKGERGRGKGERERREEEKREGREEKEEGEGGGKRGNKLDVKSSFSFIEARYSGDQQ